MRRIACALALLVVSTSSPAGFEYHERADKFSSGSVRLALVTSEDAEAMLAVVCSPASGLYVHLQTNGVIFPDDTVMSMNWMIVNITHKFDTAKSAHTRPWRMPMMKYYDAQTSQGMDEFLIEAATARMLYLKLDGRGTVFDFNVASGKDALLKVARGCM